MRPAPAALGTEGMSATRLIALDAMGGDHGPDVVVQGAELARERYPELRFRLFGREEIGRAHV